MPSLPSWLSDLSRRKLHVAASGRDGLRDTLNLRQFVLLKNSITQAEDPTPEKPTTHTSSDAYIFPSNNNCTESSPSLNLQDAWLESVLETLEESDELEVKVEIDLVEDDLAFQLDSELSDDPFDSWVYDDEYATHDDPLPFPFSSDNFLSSPSSAVLPPSLHTPFQRLINSPHSPYNQPFVEPRYPEADYDLPDSDGSSDGESDDEGPLTPYSGSAASLRERRVEVVEPEVFVDPDSYFLYPFELDLMSSPTFFQQC